MSHFLKEEAGGDYYRDLSLFFLSTSEEGPHSERMYADLFRKMFTLKSMQRFSWQHWLKWHRTQFDKYRNAETMRKEALYRITLFDPGTPQEKGDFYALVYTDPLALPSLRHVAKAASTYP